MKIIFFGTPKEVVPVLQNLIKHFEVVAVVTAPDQKSGRKQLITPSPVKVFALQNNIPVLQPEDDNALKTLLFNLQSDLFIVAAYGKIIPQVVLELPKHGAINIHPSLLPKYRGPTPIQTTLLNGDAKSGITFMKMDEKMDHGPIIHQIPFTLEDTDTFDWLMRSKFARAGQILPSVVEDYVSGKLYSQPQDDSQATYTKLISKEDGYFDLKNPPEPEQLNRMIRAFYPWPTAWTKTTINNREVKIKFLPKYKLQVEGKNPVDVKDFLNGYPSLRGTIEKLMK